MPYSKIYFGICVVLPQPVSPNIIIVSIVLILVTKLKEEKKQLQLVLDKKNLQVLSMKVGYFIVYFSQPDLQTDT